MRAESAADVNREEIERWSQYLLDIGSGVEWMDESKGTVQIPGFS